MVDYSDPLRHGLRLCARSLRHLKRKCRRNLRDYNGSRSKTACFLTYKVTLFFCNVDGRSFTARRLGSFGWSGACLLSVCRMSLCCSTYPPILGLSVLESRPGDLQFWEKSSGICNVETKTVTVPLESDLLVHFNLPS